MHVVDAELGIVRESVAIPRRDQRYQLREIAAKAEDALDLRRDDGIARLIQISLVGHVAYARFGGTIVGAQLFEHTEVEARRPGRLHVGPSRGQIRVEPGLDLLVFLLEQRW